MAGWVCVLSILESCSGVLNRNMQRGVFGVKECQLKGGEERKRERKKVAAPKTSFQVGLLTTPSFQPALKVICTFSSNSN